METKLYILHFHTEFCRYSLLVREINWMETCQLFLGKLIESLVYSLLVREINWMETNLNPFWWLFFLWGFGCTPYSLGKLIEWKLVSGSLSGRLPIKLIGTPYSLGKLIEWKQYRPFRWLKFRSLLSSLLVREINWMETVNLVVPGFVFVGSLLVREINWMETDDYSWNRRRLQKGWGQLPTR
jgi:hypothetical protein